MTRRAREEDGLQVAAVPCPLCGMPPEPGRNDPDDDGFHYMMCVNSEAGCPKESAWGQGRDEAVLAWNMSVIETIWRRGLTSPARDKPRSER
jgi:hypothetical protein